MLLAEPIWKDIGSNDFMEKRLELNKIKMAGKQGAVGRRPWSALLPLGGTCPAPRASSTGAKVPRGTLAPVFSVS